MLKIIRKMCPQKKSATIPNNVFANLLSESNCFEADCVAEKDNFTIQKGNFMHITFANKLLI